MATAASNDQELLDEELFPDPKKAKALKEESRKSAGEVLRRHSERWGKEHTQRTDELTAELSECAADAQADERLTLSLAAHGAVVAEILGRAELGLAERLNVTIDDPKLAVAYAKLMKEVSAIRGASTRRVEQLLVAAGTLRAQRQLTRRYTEPALRRVA